MKKVIPPQPTETAITASYIAPQDNVEEIVREAARKYGLNEDYFVRVAVCESTLNPASVNTNYWAGGGHPSGLFQFLPETWTRLSGRAAMDGNVFNANDNANLAAWAFANGYSGEWECA